MAVAGPHGIAIDACCGNLLAASTLDRFIDPQHERRIVADKSGDQ
jgi:hypothetical protein